ncbi:uncharacterized protein LOC101846303, partial [Aplysia californica]|uniref:Uncharacterized protein LOC101846303 n=1 Tax=Aplysia californica TaxID=6500 RepID=A0ABM1A8H7_APLCA
MKTIALLLCVSVFATVILASEQQLREEGEVNKRGWKDALAGGAAVALFGRKRHARGEVSKRGWKDVLAGGAAVALFGRKRHARDLQDTRRWPFGKRDASNQKRLLWGRRAEDEDEPTTSQDQEQLTPEEQKEAQE